MNKKIILLVLAAIFSGVSPAYSDGETVVLGDSDSLLLAQTLKGRALMCTSVAEKKSDQQQLRLTAQVSKDGKKALIRADDFCWGGSEMSIDLTSWNLVIVCGDDGRQTTILSSDFLNSKGVEASYTCSASAEDDRQIDGATYMNMAPGYPMSGGAVQYLTCCVK